MEVFSRYNANTSWTAETDEILRKLYVDEKKCVIVIGEELLRSPLSVAMRLCTLGIIGNKEDAEGYAEFKFQIFMSGWSSH